MDHREVYLAWVNRSSDVVLGMGDLDLRPVAEHTLPGLRVVLDGVADDDYSASLIGTYEGDALLSVVVTDGEAGTHVIYGKAR